MPVEMRDWLQIGRKLQQEGQVHDAARAMRAVVRVARGACREKSCKGGTAGHEDDLGETDHARLLYDALRLEAMSYFARTNAREMDVSVIEPLEMRGFDSLLAATKLLSKSCCSTSVVGDTSPTVHLFTMTAEETSQMVHALTMTACRLAYRQRDDGRPLQALRTLTHAVYALGRLANSTSARAHMLNDLCNLHRGLGALSSAHSCCAQALQLAAGAGEAGEAELEGASLSVFHFNLGKVLTTYVSKCSSLCLGIYTQRRARTHTCRQAGTRRLTQTHRC